MLDLSGTTVSAATLFLPNRRPMRQADRLLLVGWVIAAKAATQEKKARKAQTSRYCWP
jgi:hypothetical protein